jgi:class 3 adenylate cyclase
MAVAEWSWNLAVAPQVFWPIIADTARFNEAMGTPPYTLREIPRADGTVQRLAQARFGRFDLEWEERPYEWVRNQFFRQTRLFRKGPFRNFAVALTLAPDGGGTRVTYRVEAEPANAAGRMLLALGFMRRTGRAISRLIEQAAKFAQGASNAPFGLPAPRLREGADFRLAQITALLDAAAAPQPLSRRLIGEIVGGTDVDIAAMRPLAYARKWAAPERNVVELFLHAVRAGLLEMSWVLLCPRCRGAKMPAASLDQVPTGAHCDSCNIDYGRDFTRNLELAFRPAPKIRTLASGGFCLSGPMTTPHVVLQQTLAPGEAREIALDLPAGDYRLRTLEAGAAVELTHGAGALSEIVAGAQGVELCKPGRNGVIQLRNRNRAERTLVIESRDWVRDALFAHRATTLQTFRDLFSDQVLRPGDEVAVQQVTLLFTDLKGSTALYSRIGDASAYGLVREHFAYLAEAVRRHDGAIVKTIGDAIMAAFADPGEAVAAAIEVQERIGAFNAKNRPEAIQIKLGLHGGPCIAVTLNDRLDYFGSTVNLAARLQGSSLGGDIVLSAELARDPRVADLIERFRPSEETVAIKGFAAPVALLRIGSEAIVP